VSRYSKRRSFKDFLRRNVAYFIMITCVLATALIIILAARGGRAPVDEIKRPPDDDPPPGEIQAPPGEEPVDGPEPVNFIVPVANARIGYTFNLDEPVPLSVPDRNNNLTWVIFKEMEFIAPEGSPVVASYDGTVMSVKYGAVNGTVIEIDHGDGIVTSYKYLQKDTPVKAGDAVKQGDTIGHIGITYNMQQHIGAHIRFGMRKDGVEVDPAGYLDL